jgi:NADPH-dependent glutamate synthase beta subunit-like oxidoreductase/Pyruvate/2-oxoacid:ferredoxin oxidoreductase delta subunit
MERNREHHAASREQRSQPEEVIEQPSGRLYVPPCQAACPLSEDIQRNNAMISMLPLDIDKAREQILRIGDEIYEKNPFFLLCSYICGLCEKQCNYKDKTGAIRRRSVVGFIGEHYGHRLDSKPAFPTPTGEKVAVIGGGPSGLMCAYFLAQKGYRLTLMERSFHLGGALRYIPQYRLPRNVLSSVTHNLLRIARIQLRLGVGMGDGGKTIDNLENEGYRAIYIATGTPSPRPLTYEEETVIRSDLEGVAYGMGLLFGVNHGDVPPGLYRGRRVIVIGGGNVAFDVARTARRLEGDVTVLCLENEDKSSKDGIPADVEEIEGATQEGIDIVYSRGVAEVISEEGSFKKLRLVRCTSVFDDDGRFNPRFDPNEVTYLQGDVLLIAIGQGPERTFFQHEGLLNDKGRLDVDPLTLMSNRRKGVFIGGDARRIGFAMEAMSDGLAAAESIDRYISGEDLKAGRGKEFERAAIPNSSSYKAQPPLSWAPVDERLNFEPYEKPFTLEEVVEEARRCLSCGPCLGCKGCVALDLQPEIREIELNRDQCSGCGICVGLCPYDAIGWDESGEKRVASIDTLKCKRCGVCVAACPSGAISIEDELPQSVEGVCASL